MSGELGSRDGEAVVMRRYSRPAVPGLERVALRALSSDEIRAESESPPAPGAALVIVVLSSLGLWCVIWLAVSSLAAALAQ